MLREDFEIIKHELYEINDDPKRKEFLDDLFSFMQKRGTPINRLPIMAKSVLDLYELYNLVIARGGLVDVINKKLWQEIIKGLHLPSSITSAAFTLRTQYMKYLYPYECEKKNLSSPAELQAAIDGNRREGRRSSYGQYEAIHNQLQLVSSMISESCSSPLTLPSPAYVQQPMARQALPAGIQQMSPLALVTHAANNQNAQAAAAAAAAHHRLMAPSFGQMPNLMSQEIEQRMMEYLKLIQVKKEQQQSAAQQAAVEDVLRSASASHNAAGNGAGHGISPALSNSQQRQHSTSPDITPRDALNALEMSRVALWQMYHNNTSPPASVNTSPHGIAGNANAANGVVNGVNGNSEEPQREALNLSDSPLHTTNIKREREREPTPEHCDSEDFQHGEPPLKRLSVQHSTTAGFPPNFYLQHNAMAAAAAAAAAGFRQTTHDSEHEDEHDNEDEEHDNVRNLTAHSFHHEDNDRIQQFNGHHQLHHNREHQRHNRQHRQLHSGSSSYGHLDKSDDSAIENSPSTSASAGNGHISPVSTKKLLPKAQDANGVCSSANALNALNMLSGLQFRVAHNGIDGNGEQQLSVSLELNGVQYSGVLVTNMLSNKATTTKITPATKHTEAREISSPIIAAALTERTEHAQHVKPMETDEIEASPVKATNTKSNAEDSAKTTDSEARESRDSSTPTKLKPASINLENPKISCSIPSTVSGPTPVLPTVLKETVLTL